MKKILCLILVTVLSFGVLGCSSTEQEVKTYDDEFIKSLATGLESRWDLNDKYDDLVNKGEIKESDQKKIVKY